MSENLNYLTVWTPDYLTAMLADTPEHKREAVDGTLAAIRETGGRTIVSAAYATSLARQAGILLDGRRKATDKRDVYFQGEYAGEAGVGTDMVRTWIRVSVACERFGWDLPEKDPKVWAALGAQGYCHIGPVWEAIQKGSLANLRKVIKSHTTKDGKKSAKAVDPKTGEAPVAPNKGPGKSADEKATDTKADGIRLSAANVVTVVGMLGADMRSQWEAWALSADTKRDLRSHLAAMVALCDGVPVPSVVAPVTAKPRAPKSESASKSA